MKTQFFGLLRMARFKSATIQVVSQDGDTCHWNLTFVRSRNDWEEDSILSLLALLADSKIVSVGDDMILWPHDSTKKFTIKSFSGEVCKGSSFIDFPADAIWRSKAPLKAFFWAWQLPRGKYLQKRCLNEEISSWLVDALCIFKRKNQLITFSFIVGVSPGFGIYLSPY